jgi:hypothetical protein
MKFRALILGALLVAPVMVLAQQAAPSAEPPKAAGPLPTIDIVEKIKDFGTVAKGEKLRAEFVVRNTGQAPLEITQVRPTCGCTVADFDRSIAPGTTGKIRAEVDTAAFSGPIAKAVLVFSNDPMTPQLNLVIKADVRSFVEVLPRALILFKNLLSGEAATEKVTLVSADASDFAVTGADAGGGPYKIAYRLLPESERIAERKGPQWEVTITVPADAPEGMLNHRIIVKTTAAKAAEVPINVTGAVRPIVQIIPAQANLGRVKSDAPVGSNVLLVNNRQGSQLEVTETAIDNKNFKVEVIPLQAGQRFQIAISLQVGAPKGVQNGTLRITTNDPLRKVIEVPVTAQVE